MEEEEKREKKGRTVERRAKERRGEASRGMSERKGGREITILGAKAKVDPCCTLQHVAARLYHDGRTNVY